MDISDGVFAVYSKDGTLVDVSVTAVVLDEGVTFVRSGRTPYASLSEVTSADDSNGSALLKEGSNILASCTVVLTGVSGKHSEITSVASISDVSAFPTDFFYHIFCKIGWSWAMQQFKVYQ